MKKSAAFVLGGFLVCNQAMAADIDLAISERTVDAGMALQMGESAVASGSFLYHEDNGHMLNGGLYATGRSGAISGRVGVKAFASDLKDSTEGWGFAPGGMLAFHFGQKMRLEGEFFYSPSVLSFNDIDNLKQYSGRLVFSPFPTADLYLGYRNVRFNTRNGDRTLHDGGFVGLTFKI